MALSFLKTQIMNFSGNGRTCNNAERYNKVTSEYLETYEKSAETKVVNSSTVASNYYELVTDLYEFGWGECFHFAPRFKGESFDESMRRHEYFLALKIGIGENHLCLDAGCGVMGPARNLARFTGATIEGININEYQVSRCNILNKNVNFDSRLKCFLGDLLDSKMDSERFNHIYSVEAFCHISYSKMDKLYQEMYRLLKPGGRLGSYEWTITDSFDKNNAEHCAVVNSIERASGIAPLRRASSLKKKLTDAGFEIIHYEDRADPKVASHYGNDASWEECFSPELSLKGCLKTKPGQWLTNKLLVICEMLGMVPSGLTSVQNLLCEGAVSMARGAELGIFTPMFMIVAEKPKLTD